MGALPMPAAAAASADTAVPMEEDFEDEGEEEMVSVGGVQMAFSTVTEEDTQRMSDAEYQAYADLLRQCE